MNVTLFDARLAVKNKNQSQMARDVSMSPQRLSDMRAGRIKGWKYHSRICRYLGVYEYELFPEDAFYGNYNNQSSCHS